MAIYSFILARSLARYLGYPYYYSGARVAACVFSGIFGLFAFAVITEILARIVFELSIIKVNLSTKLLTLIAIGAILLTRLLASVNFISIFDAIFCSLCLAPFYLYSRQYPTVPKSLNTDMLKGFIPPKPRAHPTRTYPQQGEAGDLYACLEYLKNEYELGNISQEEYDSRRKRLIDQL